MLTLTAARLEEARLEIEALLEIEMTTQTSSISVLEKAIDREARLVMALIDPFASEKMIDGILQIVVIEIEMIAEEMR